MKIKILVALACCITYTDAASTSKNGKTFLALFLVDKNGSFILLQTFSGNKTYKLALSNRNL